MTVPKLTVPQVRPGEDAALYLNSLTDQSVVGAYMNFYVATLPIPPAEAETIELVRLRNAVAQSCAY
jgi:hypothetical protein